MGSERQGSSTALTGCLCALGCEVLFGLSYVFTKQTTENAGVLTLLGWLFLIAFLVMSACVLAGAVRIHLKGKHLRAVFLIALLNPVIYYIGETWGIMNTTASESGVFLACIPVASLAASALILHKKPTRNQVTGILITLVGVLFTVLSIGLSASFSPKGYSFLLIAVISYALFSVFVARADEFSSVEITYMMLIAGAIVFGLLAAAESLMKGTFTDLVTLPFQDRNFLIAILYLGIGCSVIAFFLSTTAIAKIGVNRTSTFIGVATVVSILSGVLLLGEPFTTSQIIGTVLILAGVYISNTGNKTA